MDFSSHHIRLLQQLDEQRKKDLFCDCHIMVEGQMFKAHRNVLFASSGYFKMLLSQSCKDVTKPTTATFDVFSADTFTAILDFVYSDDLSPVRFKCPFCTHTVKRKADLKRHLRCHTGERPYPCEACGKRFTRLEHLRNHFQTIHEAGKLICRRCKLAVTEVTGRVIQDGTRRYRLCHPCLSEAGLDNVNFDFGDDQPLVLPPENEREQRWNFKDDAKEENSRDRPESELVIQEVEDSEEEDSKSQIK